MPNLFPTNTAAVAEVDEAEEVVVDLDAEVEAGSPDADINAILPQPPARTYTCKLRLAQIEGDNPSASMTKSDGKNPSRPFVAVRFEVEIVDEGGEFHGHKLIDYANSLVQPRRQTSPLHHIMHCIGETLPGNIKIRELLERVKSAFESEPMIQVEIEWKASRKSGPGKYDWEVVASKMKQFPKLKDGDGHSQIFVYKDPKTGQTSEHYASAYVSKYLLQA